MRLSIHILASGSSGNAVLLDTGEDAVLLDAGLSLRELTRRAAAVGARLDRVRGVFISHEHEDHVRGMGRLAASLGVPVFINDGTLGGLNDRTEPPPLDLTERFEAGDQARLGAFSVRTFSTSHDARDSVGFQVTVDGLRIGVATDLGIVTPLVEQRLMDCAALVIESNHDLGRLSAGPYPWHLKQRIKGNRGHLSNEQCAELLERLCHPGLAHVVLAHLSEENNAPELAHESARLAINPEGRGPRLDVARQRTPLTIRFTRCPMEVTG